MQLKTPKINMRPTFSLLRDFGKPGLAVAVLVVLSGVFAYWFSHRSPAQTTLYTYKSLSDYKLPGTKDGSGISFKKPVEFEATAALELRATQSTQRQTTTYKGQGVVIAQVSAASIYMATDLSQTFTKNLNIVMADPNNQSHKDNVKQMQDFVKFRTSTSYNISYKSPVAFTAANIKANAWSIDFTATAKDTKTKDLQPDLTGKVILAVGNSTIYYFLINASTNNWLPNTATWNQITDSIKLDQ